jgi:hypothetical protein
MKVGIIGPGYVGLPLAVAVTRSISAENLVRLYPRRSRWQLHDYGRG